MVKFGACFSGLRDQLGWPKQIAPGRADCPQGALFGVQRNQSGWPKRIAPRARAMKSEADADCPRARSSGCSVTNWVGQNGLPPGREP